MFGRYDNNEQRLGLFSGDGGANQDDSVKASLDLAHTDLDALIAGGSLSVTKTLINWSAAAQTLFTVAGGPIRVIYLCGIVAVDIKDVSMSLSLVGAVTTPSGNTDIASALQCQNDVAGTIYTVNGTFGSIMVATTVGILTATGAKFIMPPGVINMTSSAVEDAGGSIVWSMIYQKLNSDVTVV